MCGHTEGRTVERHLNIFSILFSDKICRQFLEQHGSWVLFLCGFSFSFIFFFSFLLSLFFLFLFKSVRGGRVKMIFLFIFIIFL
ncbi:hypothetical protein TCDM_10976 [Trypanosoma cruzi Dm28c]|uniref:Uncharacterized protein n=1 Tax=Trypanosoma cruzi Dm28c TaxID=1416333 RepID=V5AL85_TRYCR|nr:hypothetical protein TCDM_10976 [Trypanosoma cruzi Dm28c]